jgi:hypothetical protein
MSDACRRDDLLGRSAAWLLWGVPIGALVVGATLGPLPRTLLWTPAFLVMGGACVLNAARCGRLHCYVTGPLYLGASLASALVGLDVVAVDWRAIGLAAVGGTVLAHLPEWARGRYVGVSGR